MTGFSANYSEDQDSYKIREAGKLMGDEETREIIEYCVLVNCTCDHDDNQHPRAEVGCGVEGCECEGEWEWPNG